MFNIPIYLTVVMFVDKNTYNCYILITTISGLTLGFQNVFVSIGGFGLEATVTAATPFLMKTFR